MNTILQKKRLADNIYSFRIKSPHIAKKAKTWHFVMIRINENGERIPLTIADYDKISITLVVQIVGNTTKQLSNVIVAYPLSRSSSRTATRTSVISMHAPPSHNLCNVILFNSSLAVQPKPRHFLDDYFFEYNFLSLQL